MSLTSKQVRAGTTVVMSHAERQAFLKTSRLGQLLEVADLLPEVEQVKEQVLRESLVGNPTVNLANLKWIKYINPQGNEPWAYEQWQRDRIYNLHWKNDQENNCRKVNRGDLILLLQNSVVTHLVEIDDDAPHSAGDGEWEKVLRQVKVRWVADFKHEDYIPRQRDLFGYSPQGYANGTVKNLENFKDILPIWHSLDIFRRHVGGLLRLTD